MIADLMIWTLPTLTALDPLKMSQILPLFFSLAETSIMLYSQTKEVKQKYLLYISVWVAYRQ